MPGIETTLRDLVREEIVKLLPELVPAKSEEYLNSRQAADLCGLSRSYFEVHRSLGTENMPDPIRVGRRVLYKRSDIEAWLDARRESAA